MSRLAKRAALLGAAVVGAMSVSARPASAGVMYDLRLSNGGGKSLFGVQLNQAFNVDVFVVVTGANGTATDDGFTNGFYSLVSNNALADLSLAANFTGGGNVAPFTGNDQDGLLQDIDGDGDTDVGKKAGDASNANFVLSRTPAPAGEFGTGAGPAEFKLATYSVVLTAPNGLNYPSINVALPGSAGTGTTGITPPILYTQDGVPQSTLADVTVGAPIGIPEPASLGLLAFAAGMMLRRRRA